MKQSLRTAFFVSLVFFTFTLHAPEAQADETTILGGMTGSNGLGQQSNSPLFGVIMTIGDNKRLELGSTLSSIRKIGTGKGNQLTGYVRGEKQLPKSFFVLAGVRGIHSDGGLWAKRTADWTVGVGVHYVHRWKGSEERLLIREWIAYNQDFASSNSPNQKNVRGGELGFRLINGTPTCSLFVQLLVQPVRYEQMRGPDSEKVKGRRVTMTLGLTRGW